jgi:hypothetical protein
MNSTVDKVKATELGIAGLSRHGVLADGGLILGVSVQIDWVYVRFVKEDGTFGRRRYRHAQMVAVEADE